MEPGELIAAYVCVGVGGFLLIVVIVMMTVLIFTGKCDFCKCHKTEEDGDHVDDKVKLKYKVEHEMQRNHNNNDVIANGSLRYHSGAKFIASAHHAKYKGSSLPGSTRSADPPATKRRRKREDKYKRVKRQKRSRSRLERSNLRSSSSSQEFSDSREKPYTLHVTNSVDNTDGDSMYPYAYIDRHGRRFRVVSNNAPVQMRREKTLRKGDFVIKSGSSTEGSLPPSRASSIKHGGRAQSSYTTGSEHSTAPQLVAAHNGVILQDPSRSKGDGPIILRWSPSMQGKARRYYTPSTSRPSSRHSSNTYTLNGLQTTPGSSRHEREDAVETVAYNSVQ